MDTEYISPVDDFDADQAAVVFPVNSVADAVFNQRLEEQAYNLTVQNRFLIIPEKSDLSGIVKLLNFKIFFAGEKI